MLLKDLVLHCNLNIKLYFKLYPVFNAKFPCFKYISVNPGFEYFYNLNKIKNIFAFLNAAWEKACLRLVIGEGIGNKKGGAVAGQV